MFKFNIFGNGQLLALKYPIDIAATLSFVVSSGTTRLFLPTKRRRGKSELAVQYKFIRHQPLWRSHRSPSLPSPSKESSSFVGASCVSGANSVGQLLSLSLSSSFTISRWSIAQSCRRFVTWAMPPPPESPQRRTHWHSSDWWQEKGFLFPIPTFFKIGYFS